MSRRVSFKQLRATLHGFGFDERPMGTHVIFKHTRTGVVVSLPGNEPTVRPIYLNTVVRQVANSGIATQAIFENRLEKEASTAG